MIIYKFLSLFFPCFFNGLHGSLAHVLYTFNFDRTAHLTYFFAIIARLTLSSKCTMWLLLLISKIFCLWSSRLQFRRNYWCWGSIIKKSNFLRVGLYLNHELWNPCEIKVHYWTKNKKGLRRWREVLFFSPLVSLSPKFFILYLFPEGFWSRRGLILKGMWELTACKQSSMPLTKVRTNNNWQPQN